MALKHGVQETTNTSGTGVLTLAAVTGYSRFSARFSVGNTVSYLITNGANKEWGIGTVGASNTLARTTITGTLVSGTYTSGGTAMVLSGSSTVSCVEHEATGVEAHEAKANPHNQYLLASHYTNKAAFPASGTTGIRYVDDSLNAEWYWNGSQYIPWGWDESQGAIVKPNTGEIYQRLFVPQSARQFRTGQPFPLISRIADPGRIWHRFTDHSVYTLEGTTTGWSLSTVSGLNGISYDSSGSKTGATTLTKLTCDATVTASTLVMRLTTADSTGWPLDGKFGYWVYLELADEYTNPPYIVFNVTKTGGTFTGTAGRVGSSNAYCMRQGWNFIPFDSAQSVHPYGLAITGSGDLTTGNVKQFRFEVNWAAGKAGALYFDSAWTAWSKPVSRFCIGKDGAGEADLLLYKAALDAQGWKGYLNHDCAGTGDMTPLLRYSGYNDTTRDSNIDTCYAAGWDIMNHSLNHNTLQGMTDAEIRYVILAQRDYNIAQGWLRGNEFYSAAGNMAVATQADLIKGLGFSAIRGFRGAGLQTTFGFDNPFHINTESFDAPRGGASAILSVWQARATAAMAYGADIWFFGHNVTSGNGGDPTGETPTGQNLFIYENSLNLFCAWLKTQEIAGLCKVVTPTEWFYGLR